MTNETCMQTGVPVKFCTCVNCQVPADAITIDQAIEATQRIADGRVTTTPRAIGIARALLEQRASLLELVEDVGRENARLDGMINNPHISDFLEAVRLEAVHQRERWGTNHDAGKSDEDWLFLVGFLGGKAVQAGKSAKQLPPGLQMQEYHLEKRLHHIITAAAVLLNWHAHLTGSDTRMRPGIEPQEGT